MSYAEHGSRIFYNGRFNSNPVLKYGDYFVPRKRSEGRLKLFGSCTDLRAWSPNPLDNCRYFRDVVEHRLPQGKIVPYDVMIETLKLLDTQTQKELVSLRRQLEKYKSLRLSPEQKNHLRDIDGFSLEEENEENEDSTSLEESKFTDEEIAVPKRPDTPEHSISGSSSNYDSESARGSKIDDESFSECRFKDNKLVASSKTDSNEYVDLSEENLVPMDNENHQSIIIQKDSEIIALKNDLSAKDVELEELKDSNRNLKTMLRKMETTLDNLRENLNISQQQILVMDEQLKKGMEESKKLYDSKCLVDHLKSTLAEKSQECSAHLREIEDLQKRIKDVDSIREERDCLLRSMKDVCVERKTLKELNREQAMHLADQDDEINRLLGLLKLKTAEHGEREIKMNKMMDDLRNEIHIKKSEISRFAAERRVSSWNRLADSASFRELTDLEIRKKRCALLEDLQEVENEIKRRRVEHRFREEDTSSKSAKRDKALIEYEQLKTVQVPRARDDVEEKDDEIYERIVLQTSGSINKIQQLVVELEPYQQERRSLINEINRLNESLEKARNRGDEARGVIGKREFNENEKRIAVREKTIETIDLERDYERMSKRSEREERDRREQEKLDEQIDQALVIHVKRSIERVERISLCLEGAGDNISREMTRKEKELEARNEEITKLRMQVASRISRGQGDHAAQQGHAAEISRVKNELSRTQRSLQRARDQLESSNFKFKGASQKIKNLGAEIDRLTKENKSLNNSLLIVNELANKSDEIQIRLVALQEENSVLREKVSETNETCADYRKKLLDFRNEGMRAKEAFERAERNFQSLLLDRDNKIDALQEQKKIVEQELKETELKVTTLSEEIRSLGMENKNLDCLEALIKEIQKVDKSAKRLRVDMESMKSQMENQRRINDKLEEDLSLKLRENETLLSETKILSDYNIERNSRKWIMSEATAKEVLDTLPKKVLDEIGALKVQLNSSESVDLALKNEINKLREKSMEDSSLMENLRREVEAWSKKAAVQEQVISGLKEDNAKLRKRMEELQNERETVESLSGISVEELIAKTEDLECKIREKDERIEKLAREIEATKEQCIAATKRVQLLTNEKTELSVKLRSERSSWESKIKVMRDRYNQQVRGIYDDQNRSIKKLEAQYKEDVRNNGNSFDPAMWLQSLTIKQMTELHKSISELTPCDALKITRALNDKQNQQLQEDEKLLYSEIVDPRIGHHKETAVGYPAYSYESRKFDKPTETPVKDNATFDMQRSNFIHQCAMEHKYDSGN